MRLVITLLLAALMLGTAPLSSNAKPPRKGDGTDDGTQKQGGGGQKQGGGGQKQGGGGQKQGGGGQKQGGGGQKQGGGGQKQGGGGQKPGGGGQKPGGGGQKPGVGPGTRVVRGNPPGPVGGRGTGKGVVRGNPPGPTGGPGTGKRIVRGNNPPGPAGGPGTGKRIVRSNPPGPTGGPGTSRRIARVNPPGPAGGPGAGPRRFDSRIVLRGLSVVPRRIARPVVIAPGAPVVVQEEPTTVVRVYDRTRNVVVVPEEDGQSAELPYIQVPILFAEGSTELLDETADADLQAVAEALLEIHVQDPNARFQIEGHSSTDCDAKETLELSVKRASHIYAILISRYGVPASILSTKGYGSEYAEYPDGTEEELQLDRRVLVVRTH